MKSLKLNFYVMMLVYAVLTGLLVLQFLEFFLLGMPLILFGIAVLSCLTCMWTFLRRFVAIIRALRVEKEKVNV